VNTLTRHPTYAPERKTHGRGRRIGFAYPDLVPPAEPAA